MSEPEKPTPPPPRRNDSVLGFLMFIAGLFMLVPGLCAIVAIPFWTVGSLWLVLLCLAVSVFGLWLLVKAVRGPKPGSQGEA